MRMAVVGKVSVYLLRLRQEGGRLNRSPATTASACSALAPPYSPSGASLPPSVGMPSVLWLYNRILITYI